MTDHGSDSWTEWSKHILAELKRLHKTQLTLTQDVKCIRADFAEERALVKENLGKVNTRVSSLTWITKTVIGACLAASLVGTFGAVNSCRAEEITMAGCEDCQTVIEEVAKNAD